MKKLIKVLTPIKGFQLSALLFSFLFSSVSAIAQETKKVDINISTDSGSNFFASPWVWVVGGAVFILLLVALLRGGGKKEA